MVASVAMNTQNNFPNKYDGVAPEGSRAYFAVATMPFIKKITWSSPRFPLRSHYLVHSGNKSYFLEKYQLVMWSSHVYFNLFPPFVRCTQDRSQNYNIFFKYTSVFKYCYNDIELCFVPYFGAESGKMHILKVHIYFP